MKLKIKQSAHARARARAHTHTTKQNISFIHFCLHTQFWGLVRNHLIRISMKALMLHLLFYSVWFFYLRASI